MVEYLRESHRMIAHLLGEADFNDAFPFVFGRPDADNAEVQVRNQFALLLRKAQMHITAAIRANRNDNLHSMAVHARVILECAAQLQFMAHAANEGSPSALARVWNASEYDFRDTMVRMSRGTIDEDDLQEMIVDAREGVGDYRRTRPRRVWVSDGMAYLSGGREWYKHLSERFCSGRTSSLSGPSMFGGVVSSNTEADSLAIALLLEYLTEQTILMLFSYGFLLIPINGDQQPFDKTSDLLGRMRADAAAFRDPLRQRVGNCDGGDELPPPPPMTERSSPLRGVELDLYSGCRRWLVLLSELVAKHTKIDAPERRPCDVDADISLRLRKSYFHINAIIAWPVDTLIIHVMGPDIRTAQRQLDPIVSDFLQNPSSATRIRVPRTSHTSSRSLLGSVSHPTPQTLIHPRHLGGLDHAETIPCLAVLFHSLAELTLNYSTALGALADRLDRGDMQELADILARAKDEIASAPFN